MEVIASVLCAGSEIDALAATGGPFSWLDTLASRAQPDL